ncbi:MFS transporter [Nocardia arthritidis]|uniref:MFS transporter n=1 Tax=Nocardia arthritidis TaxID=228602 RepID=A0A6G9YNZ5_9NOCA|nr:MFS transporter [Nocardia arthritidis]QIS15019.1 MFS transporter [Nocardia arthritidis]
MVSTLKPAAAQVSSGFALLPALFGSFLIILDASAVNVALPTMGGQLAAGMSGLQWVVDGYTLMFASVMLSAGALADRIGAGRAFACGLGGFTVASVACGLAPGLGLLVGARFLQGIAAALVLPSSLALVRQGYPDPARRAWALSMWALAGSVAVAAGPVVGGLLTTVWSWRLIFLINVPVGIVALLVLTRVRHSPRHRTPLDIPGQVTAVVALAALTFALIQGGHAGYTGTPVLLAAAVAVAAGIGFWLAESRAARPMVPFGLLRTRAVSITFAAGFAFSAGFYGIVFLLSLYLQQMRGYSALAAGLSFVPMMVLIGFANTASPWLARRFGPRVPVVGGQLGVALGLLMLLFVDGSTPVPVVALLAIPIGFGGGLAVPTLLSVLLDRVAAEQAGVASGVFNAVRQLGGAVAVALFGSLVAHDFQHGMTTSLLLGALLLLATALASLRLR